MEETQEANQIARTAFANWKQDIQKNFYTHDQDYIHTVQFCFPDQFQTLNEELATFGYEVANQLEPLVQENNLANNLPRLEAYNSIGERIDKIVHHPTYTQAGDIIYHSKLLARMSQPGGLSECLTFLFLSSQTGEAGHNCPIACSAGIIRVLQKIPDFPDKKTFLEKLIAPSFQTNFTGAQFLTEIQGGSDVGLNAAFAIQEDKSTWRIYGEKWFCSNAGADLIFTTARYDLAIPGTKGLALFLIPARWEQHKNHYTLRRLKDKIGTRSMATGEIDFHGAYGMVVGTPEEGFHLAMDNVLHLSRLFNTVCVLGMARRAYLIARDYAEHRTAFAHAIIQYPLVKESLARIKAENAAMVAGVFRTARLQDQFDQNVSGDKTIKLLLRLLVNLQKYLSARWSVEHIHHALDVLAGNGTIESFSSIPRLLRDCIVCENWEGTHNVLRAQVLKDLLKYDIEKIYLTFMENELANINEKYIHFREQIAAELKLFMHEINEFRKLDNELQTLQIQFIVDRMAILFCALALLIEALDHEKVQQNSSKMHCYQYFVLLHLSREKITHDRNYLELISRIV